MLRGLAVAIVVVCVCGLITRVLPDVWPIAGTVADERLSYPLTYWNALGLLAAVGTILCFHFACSRSEPPAVRVLGAAAVPVLTTILFFTFSRGAIAAGIVGLITYMAIARPPALLSGLVAAVPAAVVAIVAAYGADLLATADPTSPAAVDQGKEVALVVGACAVTAALLRLLLLRLDSRLSLDALPARARRLLPVALGAGAVAAVVALVALGAPGYVGDKYDRFVERGETPVGQLGDPRTRLTDPSNNGRIDQWDVAVQTFRGSPLEGEGAGTYQNVWVRERPITLTVRDAHSLYVEVLAELGLVGLAIAVLWRWARSSSRLAPGPAARPERRMRSPSPPCWCGCFTRVSTGTGRCRRSRCGCSRSEARRLRSRAVHGTAAAHRAGTAHRGNRRMPGTRRSPGRRAGLAEPPRRQRRRLRSRRLPRGGRRRGFIDLGAGLPARAVRGAGVLPPT